MRTACFIFGLLRGTAMQRTAGLLSGVLLWSSLHACAQLIGIELYDEGDVLENAPLDGGVAHTGGTGGLDGSSGGRGGATQGLTGLGGELSSGGDGGSDDSGKSGASGASAYDAGGDGGDDGSGSSSDDGGSSSGDGGSSSGDGGSSSGDGGSSSGSSGDGGASGDGGSSSGDGGSSGGDGGSGGSSPPLECTPDARRCTDNAVEICTLAGEWEQADTCLDQTCTAEGDDAACAGECAPGQVLCQAGNAFECDRGEWDLADACTSTEVCRAGECVEAHRDVGNATVLTDTAFLPQETLLIYRLPALEHDAVLEYFGIVGDVDGVQARLVLYGDRTDGLAPAGAMVAQTAGLSFGLAAGSVVAVAPASPDTRLSAGTAYWLGVVTAEATTLRAAPDASTALRVVSFSPFNAPFGPAETGQLGPRLHLNVFIGVRELP